MMDLRRIHFEFALFNEVLEPRDEVVAVDVGSTCVPGVIDHHFTGASDDCAATLVARRGDELVLGHLANTRAGELTIVTHREPDLDATIASYLVAHLFLEGSLPEYAEAIAEYARVIDEGRIPPDGLGPTSLWALYTAACHRVGTSRQSPPNVLEQYRLWLKRGFELLDRALECKPQHIEAIWLPENLASFREEQTFLEADQRRYSVDREKAQSFELALPLAGEEGERLVPGLRTRGPRAAMFRQFAQAEGFPFTHVMVDRTAPDGAIAPERHIISVAPESGVWLRGLGAALERREVEVRAEKHIMRPQPPRWPDVTNSDPWYDGRSPIHSYSVVDSPNGGTALDAEEVTRIIEDSATWIALGRPARELLCPKGCRFPADTGASYCAYHSDKLMPGIVDGHWEVEELIAEGGMGSVWRVLDVRSRQRYALKRLLPQFMRDEESWSRFRQEAALASRIAHPNIVRVITSGTSAETGPYIVTEFVKGTDLRRDLLAFQERREWYPWPRIKAVVIQVCQALAAVHGAGVLHRDLKPENIMLVGVEPGEDPEMAPPVKVLDFGLSMLADPAVPRITTLGRVTGTAEYASPEQMGNMALDERSDLYSLGAIFHELVSFDPPFADLITPMAIGMAKIARNPPPLEHRHPELDGNPRIEPLIAQLVACGREKRPKSALEVAELFEQIL